MRIMIERKENKQNWHKNRIIFNLHECRIRCFFACIRTNKSNNNNNQMLCLICAAIDSRNKSNWHRLLLLRMATVSSFLNTFFSSFIFIFAHCIWEKCVFYCDINNQKTTCKLHLAITLIFFQVKTERERVRGSRTHELFSELKRLSKWPNWSSTYITSHWCAYKSQCNVVFDEFQSINEHVSHCFFCTKSFFIKNIKQNKFIKMYQATNVPKINKMASKKTRI